MEPRPADFKRLHKFTAAEILVKNINSLPFFTAEWPETKTTAVDSGNEINIHGRRRKWAGPRVKKTNIIS
jgi:hypothetical protein